MIDRSIYYINYTRVAVEGETHAPVVGAAYEVVVAEQMREAFAEADRGHVERRRRQRRRREKEEENSYNRTGGGLGRRHRLPSRFSLYIDP